MAAPNNATLLDYEGNIEDALATYLASVITSTQVLTPRTLQTSQEILTTPRVTASLAVSGTNPNQQANRATDSGEYDSFKSGILSLTCVVRRDASGQSLGTLRGKVRAALLKPTAAFNGTNLPYYQVVTLREIGSSLSSDPENDEISSQLSYLIEWYIKPDQWAAS